MDSRQAYIALNLMQGVGPVTVRALAAALGSAEAIFTSTAVSLTAVRGVSADMVKRIIEQRQRLDPVKEEEAANKAGARLITPVDAEYPQRLLRIYDPPLALYVRGTIESRDEHGLAVVGSRRTSHYGMETAERFSAQLAEQGLTVISGLARGIDTAAHRGALKGKGRTLAVLGGGLDCLFPPENTALAKDIADHGAIITEYPMGRQPDKTTFPVRNRIVSGLAKGVLVVECDVASGAMITARQALEQGRTVFAVPGRVDTFGARGPHKLIKDGACLVENVSDILEELGGLFPAALATGRASASMARMTDSELALMQFISEEGEADLDSLIRRSGLKAPEVSALLLGLEMKRVVRMLPGQRVGLRQS